MRTEHLVTYLNDHLAGAVAALEVLEHIIEQHATNAAVPTLQRIKTDIEADRRELEMLVERLGGRESVTRKAVGWLSERVLRLKLRVDDPRNGALRLFESVEMISLGVDGKLGLWRVLASLRDGVAELNALDVDRLVRRAREQRVALEQTRCQLAREAFIAEEAPVSHSA